MTALLRSKPEELLGTKTIRSHSSEKVCKLQKRLIILMFNQAYKTGSGNDLATVAAQKQFLLSRYDYSVARALIGSGFPVVSGANSQPWKQGCHLPAIQDTRILNVRFTLHCSFYLAIG